jgi:uncharacterized protein YdeI (YjbR/CyaY-like superfamily)
MQVGETVLPESSDEWRGWLSRHHRDRSEIWLLLYKKGSGKTGVSYEEAVEEALCFGWIDGQTRSIDDEKYALRFTPRRRGSNWSDSNRTRVRKLLAENRMTEAGVSVLPPDLVPR